MPESDDTETARALLWRHGLPEDVIDGALCLHAQELAARIRTTDLPDWHVDLDLFDNGTSWAAGLIDPTVPDGLAGMSEALIDTALATAPLPPRVEHAPGKAICCPDCHAKGHSVCMDGGQQPECTASLSGRCLRESQSETACDTEAGECTGAGPGQTREIVHGCPPDGSGLTPCCGRTPFELPLGDRISSEAPTTCPGPPETP